jgi:hypothetical protein
LYLEALEEVRDVVARVHGQTCIVGVARTKTVGNWLRLAGQIRSVALDTHRYQEASFYCEPVAGMLDSDAAHHESIITPLTKLVFVCNALEECYRFVSGQYLQAFCAKQKLGLKPSYLRDYSMQAAALIAEHASHAVLPRDYGHHVDILWKWLGRYAEDSGSNLRDQKFRVGQIDHGLALVRYVRNMVAHGEFPLIDNPEYSFAAPDFSEHILVNLPAATTRVAAMNIQILIGLSACRFRSWHYAEHVEDDEYGAAFESECNWGYLTKLHHLQKFALNERGFWVWQRDHSRPKRHSEDME